MSHRVTLVLAQDYVRAARWAQAAGLRRTGWHYIDTSRRMLPLSGPAVRIVLVGDWTADRAAEELAVIEHRLALLGASGAEIERVTDGLR